jgi:hypothetical protein
MEAEVDDETRTLVARTGGLDLELESMREL